MIVTEQAAKLVLKSPEGIILPYGSSGRYNLPGGGVEDGECALDTLERELEEELGYPLGEINPEWIVERTFYTTSKTGEVQKRVWSIFAARTELLATDFMPGDDIEGVVALPREQVYVNKRVTKSAKVATALAFRAMQRRLSDDAVISHSS